MRGFGFLLFGSLSGLGIAVSTAVIRHIVKRPSGSRLQPTDDKKNSALERNVLQDQPYVEQDIPKASTPLLRVMQDVNVTDLTYNSSVCAERYGEDFYTSEYSLQHHTSESELSVPQRDMSSLGTKELTNEIGDDKPIAQEVFSERENPVFLEDEAASRDGTPFRSPEINPEKLMSKNLTSEQAPLKSMARNTEGIISFPLIMKPFETEIPMLATLVVAENIVADAPSPNNSRRGNESQVLHYNDEENKIFDDVETVTSVLHGTASSRENESIEPYLRELLRDDHIVNTIPAFIPQDDTIGYIGSESAINTIEATVGGIEIPEDHVEDSLVCEDHEDYPPKKIMPRKFIKRVNVVKEENISLQSKLPETLTRGIHNIDKHEVSITQELAKPVGHSFISKKDELSTVHKLFEVRHEDSRDEKKKELFVPQSKILECLLKAHICQKTHDDNAQNRVPIKPTESVHNKKNKEVSVPQKEVSGKPSDDSPIPEERESCLSDSKLCEESGKGSYDVEGNKTTTPQDSVFARNAKVVHAGKDCAISMPQDELTGVPNEGAYTVGKSDASIPQEERLVHSSKDTQNSDEWVGCIPQNELCAKHDADVHEVKESKGSILQRNLLKETAENICETAAIGIPVFCKTVREIRNSVSISASDKTMPGQNAHRKQTSSNTPIFSTVQERGVQVEQKKSLSSQSTPTKDTESNLHCSPVGIPSFSKEVSLTYLSKLPSEMRPISETNEGMSVSQELVTSDTGTVVTPMSSTQVIDNPVSDSFVPTKPIPSSNACPQLESEASIIANEELELPQTIMTEPTLSELMSIPKLTRNLGSSVAIGVAKTAGAVGSMQNVKALKRSSLSARDQVADGKNNIERKKSRFLMKRGSRADDGRERKRFRFAERIRIRSLCTVRSKRS